MKYLLALLLLASCKAEENCVFREDYNTEFCCDPDSKWDCDPETEAHFKGLDCSLFEGHQAYEICLKENE